MKMQESRYTPLLKTLLHDTYIIEELRSDSNKGFELIPPFEIVVSRNNLVIDLGTLTDEYEKEISIHTTATSKDGEKTILAGKEVTIVDTVKLDGLTKGIKYQLKGWQMLKEENAELIIDGKRVENDYTFVADDEEMKVEISYTFNASALGGKNLVTFEELYDFSNPDEPVKVAEHKDIEDDGQTVLITERIIKIHTTATDKDGNKELEAGKEVTIIDTVTLGGLEVGTQYKLVGWQMLKEENAELLINGKRVESDYTFTADSETKDMQANVGCEYISDLPSYKRKVWQEMKRLNPADYEERQLDDFYKYVFGMSYQTLKDVMKQQKGREEQCRKQGSWWKREEQLAKKQYHTGLTCR